MSILIKMSVESKELKLKSKKPLLISSSIALDCLANYAHKVNHNPALTELIKAASCEHQRRGHQNVSVKTSVPTSGLLARADALAKKARDTLVISVERAKMVYERAQADVEYAKRVWEEQRAALEKIDIDVSCR